MIDADFVLVHAGPLVTLQSYGKSDGPRRSAELSALGMLADGAIASSDGVIVWVGPTDQMSQEVTLVPNAVTLDADGKLVTPGLVDAHTHPVFAATREAEFEMRVAGKSYQQIAAEGGGIARSVGQTRQSTEDHLLSMAMSTADRMLANGTTTAEAKSGYGLNAENELKLLRVIQSINTKHAIDWIPTALPAHTIPPEHKGDPAAYVDLVCEDILPKIADEKLALFNDVFLEKGAIDLESTRKIQQRAQSLGFGLKFHVDQLTSSGGTELAIDMHAVSADHLDFISETGIKALAASDTIGVMLPGATYFLDASKRPPTRDLIEAGAALALATDCNPGSNMTESMPMAINQACVLYKMSPAEALVAATINAAWSMRSANRVGSLAPGKQCDCVIWDMDDYRELAYHYGVNLVKQVIKNGRRVVG